MKKVYNIQEFEKVIDINDQIEKIIYYFNENEAFNEGYYSEEYFIVSTDKPIPIITPNLIFKMKENDEKWFKCTNIYEAWKYLNSRLKDEHFPMNIQVETCNYFEIKKTFAEWEIVSLERFKHGSYEEYDWKKDFRYACKLYLYDSKQILVLDPDVLPFPSFMDYLGTYRNFLGIPKEVRIYTENKASKTGHIISFNDLKRRVYCFVIKDNEKREMWFSVDVNEGKKAKRQNPIVVELLKYFGLFFSEIDREIIPDGKNDEIVLYIDFPELSAAPMENVSIK